MAQGQGSVSLHLVLRPGGSAPGSRTYVEDVGGGLQRELHTVDDEGEGGQVLDVSTVHEKLQSTTAQVPHFPPKSTCCAAAEHPGPREPQACFWTTGHSSGQVLCRRLLGPTCAVRVGDMWGDLGMFHIKDAPPACLALLREGTLPFPCGVL